MAPSAYPKRRGRRAGSRPAPGAPRRDVGFEEAGASGGILPELPAAGARPKGRPDGETVEISSAFVNRSISDRRFQAARRHGGTMKRLLGAAIAAGLLWSSTARAQFPDNVPENIRFRVGGLYALLKTEASLSTTGEPGITIPLNDLLGEPDHKFAFRGDAYWNFAGRSYLDFGFLNISTDSTKSITRDIHFGDVTYTAGSEVA